VNEKPAPFSIDLGDLKTRRKDATTEAIGRVDAAAEQHGFVNRTGQGRRGRKPSPRTQQIHAKVLPPIADEIASEAQRRGVQQGVIIEEAWALYKTR
jgi:hypothetical protein